MKKFLICLLAALLFLNSAVFSADSGESFVFNFTNENIYDENEFLISREIGKEFDITVSMLELIKSDSLFCIEYDISQTEIVSYYANEFRFDNNIIEIDENFKTDYQRGNIRLHEISPGKIVFSLSDKILDMGTNFTGVINTFKFKSKEENMTFKFYLKERTQEEIPGETPDEEITEDIVAVCYTENNKVIISGSVKEGENDSVSLILYDNNRLCSLQQTKVDKNNLFSFDIPLPDTAKDGTYTAKLTRFKNGNSYTLNFEYTGEKNKNLVYADAVVEENKVVFSGTAPKGYLNNVALVVYNDKDKLCYLGQTNINPDGSFEIVAILEKPTSKKIYTAKLMSYYSLVTTDIIFVY